MARREERLVEEWIVWGLSSVAGRREGEENQASGKRSALESVCSRPSASSEMDTMLTMYP